VAGFFTVTKMKREMFTPFSFDMIKICVDYTGASPQ
jgi:hypothetical protein